MAQFPGSYWASYEHKVNDVAAFMDAVRRIAAYEAAADSRFVWRGAADASWGLHSSLARAFMKINGIGEVPTEQRFQKFEREVFEEAIGWGLDWHTGGGRLSCLELMAALQHYGVPTRLLDFTMDPFLALWFAVEKLDDISGRVFCIDIKDSEIGRTNASRSDLWWTAEPSTTGDPWCTSPWYWKPPPLEPRIVRQDGCFVLGGVPSTQPARKVYRDVPTSRIMRADEVRKSMSIPFRLINYRQAEAAFKEEPLRGAQPKLRAFTVQFVGDKAEARRELDRIFGHSYKALFPDFPGFADHGSTFRKAPQGGG